MHSLSLLLLLPSLALAQTGNIPTPPTPSRGVTLPPTSAALVDEATALNLNPASLRFVGPAQLLYLHERALAPDLLGDGLYLGATLWDGLAAGFSLEWIRGHGVPAYRRTGLGLALGSPALSLGAGWHGYASADDAMDSLYGFDLGVTWRPTRFLSMAAVAQDLGAPEVNGLTLPRRYDAALGVRPLGEALTLGVDYLVTEGGWGRGRLTWTLQGRLMPWLGLSAGLSHGVTSGRETVVQVAATLDTSNLGLTYAGGGTSDGLDHVVQVRLSGQKYPTPGATGLLAVLDFDERLSEKPSAVQSLLGMEQVDPYLRLLRWMELAARDERLAGVMLKLQNLPGVDWGQAEELRQGVLRLRKAGKKVLSVLYSVDDRAYYVGSAADEVYALPGSSLLVNGLSATFTYVGGTMEKLGVQWDVARVGEYKTAPEQLTRKDLSPAQRESTEAYLDTQANHYAAGVAASRKLSPERVHEAWAVGLLSPRKAQALGLVDEVLEPSKLDEKLQALVPGGRYAPDYWPRDVREGRWGSRRRIAVVPVLGTISGGRSRGAPLGTEQIAGAETVLRALEEAKQDASVVAIVLRVDSPGGDVLASDLMYHAVLDAREAKPVVASMGGVAASGGYYAAMGANEIYASPTTLTGSIGVFYLKPALRGLGEKLGVNQETLKRGPRADILGLWRPWTEEEQAAVQAWVDESYDDFITGVAKERKLEKARVDAVARGRVWSGQAAKERGLVDTMGGLVEALDAARRRAGVSEGEELEVVVLGEAKGELGASGAEPLPTGLTKAPGSGLPPGWEVVVRELGLESPAMLTPGLKALLPYALAVQ